MQSKTTDTRSRPLVPTPTSDDVLNTVIRWGRGLNNEAPWVEDREVIPLLALFDALFADIGSERSQARNAVSVAGSHVSALVGAGHLDLYDVLGQRTRHDVWTAHFVKLTPFGVANAKLRAFASGDQAMLAVVDIVTQRGGR